MPATAQAGDALLLYITTNDTTGTITDTVAGWTLVQSRNGNAVRGRVWTKTAVAGVFGGKRLRARYRSTTPDILASALIRIGEAPEHDRIVDGRDLR